MIHCVTASNGSPMENGLLFRSRARGCHSSRTDWGAGEVSGCLLLLPKAKAEWSTSATPSFFPCQDIESTSVTPTLFRASYVLCHKETVVGGGGGAEFYTLSLTQGYLYRLTLPKSSPVASNCFPWERSTEFTSVPSAPSGQIPTREKRQIKASSLPGALQLKKDMSYSRGDCKHPLLLLRIVQRQERERARRCVTFPRGNRLSRAFACSFHSSIPQRREELLVM